MYGAGLLVVLELARVAVQLRVVRLAGRGTIRARLVVVLLFAGVGAGCAGITAIVVTVAPARSVATTAAGAVAVAAAFTVIGRRAGGMQPPDGDAELSRDAAREGRSARQD